VTYAHIHNQTHKQAAERVIRDVILLL